MSEKQKVKHVLGRAWCRVVDKTLGKVRTSSVHPSEILLPSSQSLTKKHEQTELHNKLIKNHSNGISCFLLVAGVNIFTNSELGVRGLAEILVSDLAALAHPPGGRAP